MYQQKWNFVHKILNAMSTADEEEAECRIKGEGKGQRRQKKMAFPWKQQCLGPCGHSELKSQGKSLIDVAMSISHTPPATQRVWIYSTAVPNKC